MALDTNQYGYLIDPLDPITDDKGTTIKDGFIRVYIAGSSTPVITYRNYDGAVNEKTIELDNSGRCKYPIIVNKSIAYKVVVYDAQHSQETPIITVDKMFAIGASVTVGAGATVVQGLDDVEGESDGFVTAEVEGTTAKVKLDATNVSHTLNGDAAVSYAANAGYMVPALSNDPDAPGYPHKLPLAWIYGNRLNAVHTKTEISDFADDNDGFLVDSNAGPKFMKWKTLANKVLGFIKSLSTTITAFRTGDVIPVDGPSGTAKMSKDSLLAITAQNAVDSGVAGSKIVQDELVKASTEGVTDLATIVDEQRRFNASGMVYTNSTTKFVYSQVSEGDFVECHSPRIAGERMCLAFSSSAPVVGEKVDNVLYYNETEATSDPFIYKFIAPSNGYIIANVRNAVASANVHFLTATYCNKLNGIDTEIDEAIDKKVHPLFSDLQKTGQFTTADGYTNKTLFTGLDIKSGEKFTIRFSCDENSLTMLQLWVNNAYNQTLRNSDGQINSDVVITASSDITSVGVLIISERVSATSNFTMSVVSGKVKDLYIKTDELRDEIDEITYSDQKTGQFTTADGFTNKTLFSGLNIKNGQKFVVRFNCDADSLTMLQLWVNNAYNQTLKNRDGQINADVVLTASSNITSIGILITSERVTATSNFTMTLSSGLVADINTNLKNIDSRLSRCEEELNEFGLPSYYTSVWKDALINKVLDAMSCDNCFAMMFATDLHFNSNSGYSKNLMRMILDKTSVPIAVLGGDYVAAYGDSDDCDFAREKLLEFFAYVGKDKCFSVRGNHDFTVKTSAEMVTRDPNTGVTETKGYALNAITRPSCKYEPSIVSDEFYYYIDFPATKTRVMMINSCDAQVADPTASWGVYIYLTPSQIKWIAQTCLEKDGWNFVFAFHVPSDPALDSYASSQDEIQKIAKAINNNEVYTYGGETYDFSATTSKVLFTVSGHGHRDGSNVLDGVLNIETTSDAYYHDDVWTRTPGTVTEQAFDVFVVDFDAGKLKAIRVGAGDDREWNL